jgi:hypothetical protein
MRWSPHLVTVALEVRYKDPEIARRFATKNSNAQKMKELWEDTLFKFRACALAERAWGEEEPRKINMKQFKNKLGNIHRAYKAKRMALTKTGNRCDSDDESGDDGRKYDEMPADIFSTQPLV